MKRELLLAIDGGGTKTDAALFCPDGGIVRRLRGPGCNPNDIGFEAACSVLTDMLENLLSGEEGLQTPLTGVFAGLSGGTIGNYRARFHDFLCHTLQNARVIANHSDAMCALSSGAGHSDACAVISGTGSIAYARRGDTLFRAGGWGYLLDKGGSGYDFGRDALYWALCAADGRGEPTVLTELLTEKLHASPTEAIEEIYQKGKPFIASLAPLVFQALHRKDAVARRIFEENSIQLALLLNTIAEYMEVFPCKTVLTGSIFRDFEDFKPFLLPKLKREHIFLFPTLPPLYGSAVEAMAAAGLPLFPLFSQNFQKTLA